MTCQARRYGDQMQCGQCGLSWDVSDAERPACDPQLKTSQPVRVVVDPRITKSNVKVEKDTPLEDVMRQIYRNLGQNV